MLFHKAGYFLVLCAKILHASAAGNNDFSSQCSSATTPDTAAAVSLPFGAASSQSDASATSGSGAGASSSVSTSLEPNAASSSAASSSAASSIAASSSAAFSSAAASIAAASSAASSSAVASIAAASSAASSSAASSSAAAASAASGAVAGAVNGATDVNATKNAVSNNNGTNNDGGASASVNGNGTLTLDANAVQTGSQSNGLQGAAPGQSASATDDANFINFCSGKTLTNGLQIAGGSCNGIVMGDIPSSSNMISTIITNPGPGDSIPANQEFNVNVQIANLVAGSFTNPESTYYAAPQALKGGKVVGHTHVTIQSLGNDLKSATPPNPATFTFFKGINDAGDGNGGLSAVVAGGLPAGVYRVCTMTSASNHQPVTMPLAQRGAQDDCNKFTVTTGGASSGNSSTSAVSAASNSTSSIQSRAAGNVRRFTSREFVA